MEAVAREVVTEYARDRTVVELAALLCVSVRQAQRLLVGLGLRERAAQKVNRGKRGRFMPVPIVEQVPNRPAVADHYERCRCRECRRAA